MTEPCLRSVPLDALIAEIRRRTRAMATRALVRVGPELSLDVSAPSATWRGRTVALTPRECSVLLAIAGAHPTGLSGLELAELVWARKPDVAAARVYVHQLRLKLPGLLTELTRTSHRYRLTAGARRVAEHGEAAG